MTSNVQNQLYQKLVSSPDRRPESKLELTIQFPPKLICFFPLLIFFCPRQREGFKLFSCESHRKKIIHIHIILYNSLKRKKSRV